MLKCFYLFPDNGPQDDSVVCVRILEGYGADEIRAVFVQTFGIDEEGIVLKVSLIKLTQINTQLLTLN